MPGPSLAGAKLEAAEILTRTDHPAGLAALDALFRAGGLPAPPPEGFFAGHFAAFALPRGLSWLAGWAASTYAPWLGKTFDPAEARGANVVRRRFLPVGRLFWPLYRGYFPTRDRSYHAFPFHTYDGFALLDLDVQVLKIDYDLPDNPRFIVRRVLDEIVQVEDDLYLGRWHFRWPGGRWPLVGYFVLQRPNIIGESPAMPPNPY